MISYVSPTGSDEDPGTIGEPFLTIAHAASIAQAGDRIHLLDGTFDETTQPSFATIEPISIPAGVTPWRRTLAQPCSRARTRPRAWRSSSKAEGRFAT